MDTAMLDRALGELRQAAETWADLAVRRRAALLRECLKNVPRVAERQVEAALRAKGWSPDHTGEEILAGPLVVARNLRLLLRTLDQIARRGSPQLPPGAVFERPGGQVAVRVLPSDPYDRLLYRGIGADVWLQPGVRARDIQEHLAPAYRRRHPARVALVLGAGNVASIAPLDVAYKLFVEGAVCLLKMNPVNAYLAPFIEETFAPLVRAGFVRLVGGGADVGAYLCQHEGVDEVHITGSAATHDAIVYGAGEQGLERKRRDDRINTKPITSELGNVGPVIVVPGVWSASALRFQAENVATQLVNNAGFNCNAVRVLVTHGGWAQRGAFLDHLREVLRRLPTRRAYYPGAAARHEAFVGAHPEAERIGEAEHGRLPWTLIAGVDHARHEDICFTTEAFCAVVAETTLPATDAADFLRRAVTWCNDTLWGSLSAAVLIDPLSAGRLGPQLDAAIADLRYGSVALNHWPALSYGLGTTTWGAFPGHPPQDIQSGVGVVHNSYMLHHVQKTVVRGPFALVPKPPWFVTHANQLAVARRMLRFEASPSPWQLPGILAAALRG